MATRLQRQQRIVELLNQRSVRSQQQMQHLLGSEGIEATQATLSRDFRDLGVAKGPDGYTVPPPGTQPHVSSNHLIERALERELVSADAGGTLVVLRTRPGHANALAFELDCARWPEIMGTIAGDDTVFVATRSPRLARSLLTKVRRAISLEV